jgi:hypothetical protein
MQHPLRPLAPALVVLNDPEGPEKYDNTEVKYGQLFYSWHKALDTFCCEVR